MKNLLNILILTLLFSGCTIQKATTFQIEEIKERK